MPRVLVATAYGQQGTDHTGCAATTTGDDGCAATTTRAEGSSFKATSVISRLLDDRDVDLARRGYR